MSAEARIVKVQEELEHLSNRKKDLEASILNNDEKLSNQSSIISNIQEEISFMETALSLSNADIESLQLLKQGLVVQKNFFFIDDFCFFFFIRTLSKVMERRHVPLQRCNGQLSSYR